MAQNYFGFKKPANKIVIAATDSCFYSEYKLESATNAYAGRAAMRGTNDDDVVVADGVTYMAHGFIGYEQSFLGSSSMTSNRPATVDTIWAASARVPVLKGGGFWVVAALAAGVVVYKGDLLAPTTGGVLMPVVPMGGGYAMRIPFTKKTSEYDTGIDLPAGAIVRDAIIYVGTNVAGSTIDVGMLSSESGGDADGFVDGESCANKGFVAHVNGDATEANNTRGDLIALELKSNDTTPLFFDVPKPYICDGTPSSISYTTSDHAIAGYIYLVVDGAGMAPIAIAEESVITTTTAVTDLMVRSLI